LGKDFAAQALLGHLNFIQINSVISKAGDWKPETLPYRPSPPYNLQKSAIAAGPYPAATAILLKPLAFQGFSERL
jgi:hypothetical protein